MKYITFVLLATVFTFSVVSAQPWSEKQKSVLKDIDAYVASTLTSDVPDQMTYFHPSFLKWQMNDDKPTNRELMEQSLRHADEEDLIKTIAFDSKSIDVIVKDSSAVLFLKWTITKQNEKGKDTTSSHFLTATMLETNGKWLFTSWSEK